MRPTDDHRAAYLGHLERSDRRGAIRLAVELLDAGMSLGDIVLEVLAPAQSELGIGAPESPWTRAQELAFTDVAEAVLAVAAAREPARPARGALVLCLVVREHHNLPARMMAELLRAEGFTVTFLGAPAQPAGVARFLATSGADALMVSCAASMNLPGVVPLVQAAHGEGVPVIGGGRGFGLDDVRADRLGVDARASTLNSVGDALLAFAQPSCTLGICTAEILQQRELAAIHTVLAEELSERIEYQQAGLVTRGPRSSRRLRSDMRTLLRFLEASVLCDDRILAEYASWFAARAGQMGYDERLAPLLFRSVEDRLAIDVPAAAPPLRAARAAADDTLALAS